MRVHRYIIQSWFETKSIDHLIYNVDEIFICKIRIELRNNKKMQVIIFSVINAFWTFHLNVKWSCKYFLTKLDEKRDQFVTNKKKLRTNLLTFTK